MLNILEGQAIKFSYTNWKGESGTRRAVYMSIYHGSTEYHPETQWLMEAHDLDKHATRIFAMRDMSNVKYIKE
ncbi:hypothetical protein SAMN04487895_101517 [Paenibacillus sophorae]|uniref:WYL domain-containing protein n=1 Tax=Paenibacillus sophorae TaxID=1333845 RepID=A0A1H8GHG6_9BACL|nr:hypothetical protein [Paenibacillus sophorae]QWU14226.1 hypothetical protein KP014_20155 [Paenibacillus sophorae]SEN43442.1 hypothetical protein SAMN04487895_101517 [Paenibacillus sophorae]